MCKSIRHRCQDKICKSDLANFNKMINRER